MSLINYTNGEHKLDSYYSAYDREFISFKDKPIKLLEIGVQGGGSLIMWRKYFAKADITGADINPWCKKFETTDITVKIGDQLDKDFISGSYDIVIDDGGHTMEQQIGTFEILFPAINKGGLYVIEDLHTSFWKTFEGKEKATDFVKNLTDGLHEYANTDSRLLGEKLKNKFNIHSIHFYPSIVFIWKN